MNAWERWGRPIVEITVLALVVLVAARQEIHMPPEAPHSYIGTRFEHRGVPIEIRVESEPEETNPGHAQVFMNKLRETIRQIDLDIAKNGPIVEGK